MGTGTLQEMSGHCLRCLAAAGLLLVVLSGGGVQAQKPGGVLRIYHRDSPASMSIHEEGTNSVAIPMMAVFNNLVLYDQHVAQNSLDTIVPDLAESWSWSEDGLRLTFKLRERVKWHDGRPFTSADVKCTWDLLSGRAAERLRLNPRKSWWNNVAEIAADGPAEVTSVLKRPQPAILALIASGYTPIYPCHVSPRDMRQHPIGTGPFKFVEFKPNEGIKLARNPDYWKSGRPYLDGIEYTIIPNRSTAILAFVAGKFDLTFPYEVTVPLVKDVKQQVPQAVCNLTSTNASTNLLVNREAPPFDNPDLRRALALALDRRSFIEILSEGQGDNRRRDAAAAGRGLGYARRFPRDDSRLWPRRGEEPCCSPRDHAEARLWARQAAGDQSRRPQHPRLSRPGHHLDRPAQGDLDRRRARRGRDRELVPQARPQRLPDRPQQYR
jgi:peptide/nickel transport system substrate-binding protein